MRQKGLVPNYEALELVVMTPAPASDTLGGYPKMSPKREYHKPEVSEIPPTNTRAAHVERKRWAADLRHVAAELEATVSRLIALADTLDPRPKLSGPRIEPQYRATQPFEEVVETVQSQYRVHYAPQQEGRAWAWVVATAADHVLASGVAPTAHQARQAASDRIGQYERP